MKKFLLALAAMVLLLLTVSCMAEEEPNVSFSLDKANVNGGARYDVKVTADKAFDCYTVVAFRCDDWGTLFNAAFNAGETESTVSVNVPEAEKKHTVKLSFEESENYTAQGVMELQVYPLPRVEFYRPIHIGYVGKELNVIFECKNPANLLKEYNVIELRDETGYVFGTKEWKNPSSRTNITFAITEEMMGRHDLSVWYNGVKVSEDGDGYCAIHRSGDKIISTFETEEPYMCITLDCAYSDDQTIEILDVLDKYGVKVTFFMTGHYVNTFTETAREMVARGHEIGNHSLSHPNLATQCTQVGKRLEQIRTPVDDIYNLLGVRARLFRPPYGAYDGEVLAMVRAEGMEMAKWTIDSHDWDEEYKNSPERIVRRVTKDVKGGTVILFHIDGFNTPKVLDEVIPYYQNELGLKLVTVSEMCEIVGRELPPVPHADSHMVEEN